jgi:pimeloyl-ACP methyl ester carboxylesterase
MDGPVEDRFITLNGLRFHYREWGSDQAPPLILLHGWSGHARAWDAFAAAMADSFRVIALDQRGHGESEWAESFAEYALEHRVADLDALVQTLQLPHVSLIGFSGMGGPQVAAYAATHPEVVERLVLEDCGRPEGSPVPPAGQTAASRPPPTINTVQEFDDPQRLFAETPVHPLFRHRSEAMWRHLFDNNIVQRPDDRWTLRFDSRVRTPRGLTNPPRDPAAEWAAMARIACPTLMVRGAESGATDRATAERMAHTIPASRLVEVPNAGHWVWADNPEGYLAVVRPFLLDQS